MEVRDLKHHAPLMISILYIYPKITEVLLENGADVRAVRSRNDSFTALHLAAEDCQSDMIRLLLTKKANVNAMSRKGTPLCLSAKGGDVTSIRLLINAGADLNLKDPGNERTPLFIAACSGCSDAMKLLLDSQADDLEIVINRKDKYGKTLLFCAAENGHKEVAKILLDAGARPDIKCSGKEDTNSCIAARRGHFELVKLLLQYPVDINKPNIHGDSPLMQAASYGDIHIV
jgi:ankyrin repeat protein